MNRPDHSDQPDPADHLVDRLTAARERLLRFVTTEPARWLWVDVVGQRLHLVIDRAIAASLPVSTAAAGVDARENSHGTPPGAHRIERKIGDGAPTGAVFESREPTGEIWTPESGAREGRASQPPQSDFILTRVLTLEGLESGVNRGPGVDSRERYIYLHGTNDEERLGEPVSHGCVRLANADIRDLFDRIDEGDPVVIG